VITILTIATIVNSILLIVLAVKAFRVQSDDRERIVRDEFRQSREEAQKSARDLREELGKATAEASRSLISAVADIGKVQQERLQGVTTQLQTLSDSNQQRIDALRTTVDGKLTELQQGNEKKLEEMRKTVDERLHESLDKRLGESFTLVSERLEAVQRGLGEMNTLVTGVGDLKRVLSNVKVRGTWAEYQLGAILDQMLSPEQFMRNARVNENTADVVEFAVQMPGPKGDMSTPVLLPIDSKFPIEDYSRILDASDRGDAQGVLEASSSLVRTIRNYASTVSSKYINPPTTTPFAVIYLPTEGLFAEVLRQPSLHEELQNKYHIVIAGPTTLSALLSSLQAGFLTLAIERRASEVWTLLGAVKTEFGRFAEVLQKVDNQLETAKKTLGQTGTRTRAIERKLRDVQKLPEVESRALLAPENLTDIDVVEEDSQTEGDDLPF
jgi:DNA recombination protein RmuC